MSRNAAKSVEYREQSNKPARQHDMLSSAAFLLRWNTELIGFYTRRYQQYWQLPLEVLSCRSVDDLHELQEKFRKEILEDYRAEVSRLSSIATEVSDEAEGFDNGYASGLLKAQEDAAVIIDQAKKQAERILNTAHDQAAELESGTTAGSKRKQAI
jgi:vacuolar-type H+-ATPase subunit H